MPRPPMWEDERCRSIRLVRLLPLVSCCYLLACASVTDRSAQSRWGSPDAAAATHAYRWHATLWFAATSLRTGTSSAQRGIACGQRVWKRQPEGGASALGTSPAIVSRSCLSSGCAGSAAISSACVYGCSGCAHSSVASASLDDLAEIHDRDAVADMRHAGEIVADEQVAHAERRLQMLQLVHDLRADRHVERRDRLVQHDQPRVGRPAPGRWRCAGAARR